MSTTDRAFVKAYGQRAALPDDRQHAPQAAQSAACGNAAFRPAYQVERVAWPAVIDQMSVAAADQLDRLAEQLHSSTIRHGKRVGFFGLGQPSGCTTVLIAVARRLLQDGRQVAMIDACSSNPQLAARLALQPEVGWENMLTEGQTAHDVTIEALDGRLRILPLVEAAGVTFEANRCREVFTAMLSVLSAVHDVVLIDFGTALDSRPSGLAAALPEAIDVALVVFDRRCTPPHGVADRIDQLRRAGVPAVGAVENFASSPPTGQQHVA